MNKFKQHLYYVSVVYSYISIDLLFSLNICCDQRLQLGSGSKCPSTRKHQNSKMEFKKEIMNSSNKVRTRLRFECDFCAISIWTRNTAQLKPLVAIMKNGNSEKEKNIKNVYFPMFNRFCHSVLIFHCFFPYSIFYTVH